MNLSESLPAETRAVLPEKPKAHSEDSGHTEERLAANRRRQGDHFDDKRRASRKGTGDGKASRRWRNT
jgi:hypothetical protein